MPGVFAAADGPTGARSGCRGNLARYEATLSILARGKRAQANAFGPAGLTTQTPWPLAWRERANAALGDAEGFQAGITATLAGYSGSQSKPAGLLGNALWRGSPCASSPSSRAASDSPFAPTEFAFCA